MSDKVWFSVVIVGAPIAVVDLGAFSRMESALRAVPDGCGTRIPGAVVRKACDEN
ncbi:hypothetical protein ACQUFY_14745 [Robbsia andropogonis]|uniref:hypothetical protein n=1 Tax=Robbsia andropogonis TaxID=28092 RepID=UPI0004B571BF|nr:hypothetical protein [Robbsia andropogonis]